MESQPEVMSEEVPDGSQSSRLKIRAADDFDAIRENMKKLKVPYAMEEVDFLYIIENRSHRYKPISDRAIKKTIDEGWVFVGDYAPWGSYEPDRIKDFTFADAVFQEEQA